MFKIDLNMFRFSFFIFFFFQMEFDENVHPQTLKEAQQMLEDAIDALEYEKIEFLNKEIESLKNFNDVVEISKNVSHYIVKRNSLNDNCNRHCKITEEQATKAIANSKNFFKLKLREVKKRQKRELLDVLDEWTEQRNILSESIEGDYDSSIETSKILARSNRIQEAIQIRDKAIYYKETGSSDKYAELDAKYEKLCKAIHKSHKLELKSLVEKQKTEEAELDIMRQNAQTDAQQNFVLSNAQTVVEITEKTSPEKPNPAALKMQTVNVTSPTPAPLTAKESLANIISMDDINLI